MLRINLVPEKTKKEINLKKIYAVVKGIDYLLVFLAILTGAIFISSKIFLLESTNLETNTFSSSDLNNSSFKEPIEINGKLSTIKEILNKNHSYFDIINNIANKIPEKISIFRLKIDTENKTIEIKGRADQRDDLIELKERLKNDTLYKNIDFPLQNLLKKEDVDFSISAELVF
jgi:Tfp pilus assembly protein PilN